MVCPYHINSYTNCQMIGIVKWDGTKGWTSLKVYEKKVLELKRKAKARLVTKESTIKNPAVLPRCLGRSAGFPVFTKVWLCWSFNGAVVPWDPRILESCLANRFPTASLCEVLKRDIYLRNRNMLHAITLFTDAWLLSSGKDLTSKWGPLVPFSFTDLGLSVYHCSTGSPMFQH